MKIQGVLCGSIPLVCLVALAMPGTAFSQETSGDTDTIGPKTAYVLPGGAKIGNFDISWVDPFSRVFLLADRTNKSMDLIDLNTGAAAVISPTGANAFEGLVTDPNVTGPNDVSGPNGVLTVHHTEAWIADAPSFGAGGIVKNSNPAIAYAADNCDSPVYVIDIITQKVTDKIDTGGCFRADEAAWDPPDEIYVVANPGEMNIGKGTHTAPFITFISTWPVPSGQSHKILMQITFDGSNGTPNATSGIEQASWSPKTGFFYIAIPQNGPDANVGALAVIDPAQAKGPQIIKVYPVLNCSPNGTALGPDFEIFLGCSAGPVQVLDIRNGNVVATIPQITGCDEVTFNPGDNHFAGACAGQIGIVDSVPPIYFDQNIPGISHSMSSDPVLNLLLAPVPSTSAEATSYCGTANGCIGGFGPSGTDDSGSWAPPSFKDNGRGNHGGNGNGNQGNGNGDQ